MHKRAYDGLITWSHYSTLLLRLSYLIMNSMVYLGLWTNWSRGQVLGATLTTTKAYGNLLISFTAIFVAFVTTRLWKIICLFLHRYYSTAEPREAIHHQRQVVLRNSTSPEAGLFDIVRLFWAWRGLGMKRILGLLPIFLFAVVYVIALTIASGFSSTISIAAGTEVLIRSEFCGLLLPNGTLADNEIQDRFWAETLYGAASYAQQCYNTGDLSYDEPNTMACNKYVVSSLPTAMVNYTSDCPFKEKICRNNKSTIRLDSGYIDSNNELGLNTPQNARLAVRYVLQCAPLEEKGYTSHVVENDRGWDRYHYGNVSIGPADDNRALLQDFIYEIEDIKSQYRNRSQSLSPVTFKLGQVFNRKVIRVASD